MIKPDSLRAALTAACPQLRVNPQELKVYLEKGQLRTTGEQDIGGPPKLGFEYAYTLQLQLFDFAGHPDTVMVPVLLWISVNQPELLQNFDKQRAGIRFEADILDDGKVDLDIQIDLTERVGVVRRDDGGYDCTHFPEPPVEPGYDPPIDGARLTRVFLGPDLVIGADAP